VVPPAHAGSAQQLEIASQRPNPLVLSRDRDPNDGFVRQIADGTLVLIVRECMKCPGERAERRRRWRVRAQVGPSARAPTTHRPKPATWGPAGQHRSCLTPGSISRACVAEDRFRELGFDGVLPISDIANVGYGPKSRRTERLLQIQPPHRLVSAARP
jgi:hypothetical protein